MAISNHFLAHIKSILSHPIQYFATFIPQEISTDYYRWSNLENLKPEWDERTRLIAELIPDAMSVIEFGAARLVLPKYLPPDCNYQPADLVKRSDDTIVIDLNAPLPKLSVKYQFAVFSGVLEYVHNPSRVFRWLSDYADFIVFSYAVTDNLSDPISRRRNGWVTNLSDQDVSNMICDAGLICLSTHHWKGQNIYYCTFQIDSPLSGAENITT